MSVRWSLIRTTTLFGILSLAATAGQAAPADEDGPSEPVEVSYEASGEAVENSQKGIDRANEARGTEEEEETLSEDQTTDSDLLL